MAKENIFVGKKEMCVETPKQGKRKKIDVSNSQSDEKQSQMKNVILPKQETQAKQNEYAFVALTQENRM